MARLFLTFSDAEGAIVHGELLDGDLAAALAHAAEVQAGLPFACYCRIEPAAPDLIGALTQAVKIQSMLATRPEPDPEPGS